MLKIFDGRPLFYQWDINRKLLVTDSSIIQVHFADHSRDVAMVLEVYELDGSRVVDVPNILLQDDGHIIAYAYRDDHTRLRYTFKVLPRPQPEGYVYSETQVLTAYAMMERTEAAAAAAGASADSAAQSAEAAAESAQKAEQAAGKVKDGASAYELAQESGFRGTMQEWLESLRGAQGHQGEAGAQGADGAAGKSAYEYAQEAGYEGTEEEFSQQLATGGAEEIVISATEPTDENVKIWINPDEEDDANGGGGINVTAEVGQTIRVKAVDANGKPTEWEAVDYQPRTHWSEAAELMPETTIECEGYDSDGDGVVDGYEGVLPYVELDADTKYSVVYNGVEYVCVPLIEEDEDFRSAYVGNPGAMDESISNTGEPFLAMFYRDKTSVNTIAVIAPLDGSTTITLSIRREVVTKIPDKYIDGAFIKKAVFSDLASLVEWASTERNIIKGKFEFIAGISVNSWYNLVPQETFQDDEILVLTETKHALFYTAVTYLRLTDSYLAFSRYTERWLQSSQEETNGYDKTCMEISEAGENLMTSEGSFGTLTLYYIE